MTSNSSASFNSDDNSNNSVVDFESFGSRSSSPFAASVSHPSSVSEFSFSSGRSNLSPALSEYSVRSAQSNLSVDANDPDWQPENQELDLSNHSQDFELDDQIDFDDLVNDDTQSVLSFDLQPRDDEGMLFEDDLELFSERSLSSISTQDSGSSIASVRILDQRVVDDDVRVIEPPHVNNIAFSANNYPLMNAVVHLNRIDNDINRVIPNHSLLQADQVLGDARAILDRTTEALENMPPEVCGPAEHAAGTALAVVAKPPVVQVEQDVNLNFSEDDSGQMCTVCYENWSSEGAHRLIALKCGHLYGKSCIDRWLAGGNNKCPQCQARCRKTDIRVIYAKSVKVIDNGELENVSKQLETERETRKRVEQELAVARLRYTQAELISLQTKNELKTVKDELKLLQEISKSFRAQGLNPVYVPGSSISSHSQQSKGPRIKFTPAATCQMDEGSRLLVADEFLRMLLVSQRSKNTLFPGYGVRKINMMDMRQFEYVPIHEQQIKDMAFNERMNDGMLITVAADKTIRLTNMLTNSAVHYYPTQVNPWSCAWNTDKPYQFACGMQNGSVYLYDIRQTSGHYALVAPPMVAGSPVVSVKYVPHSVSAGFTQGGFLVGQLDRCMFYESCGSDFKPHSLAVEGSLTSISFDKTTRQILVTCRPSSRVSHVRHMVCDLTSSPINGSQNEGMELASSMCTLDVIHTFQGGSTQKMLARTELTTFGDKHNSVSLACAGDESTQSLLIWDVTTGDQIERIPQGNFTHDITHVNIGGENHLVLLIEKFLKTYRVSVN